MRRIHILIVAAFAAVAAMVFVSCDKEEKKQKFNPADYADAPEFPSEMEQITLADKNPGDVLVFKLNVPRDIDYQGVEQVESNSWWAKQDMLILSGYLVYSFTTARIADLNVCIKNSKGEVFDKIKDISSGVDPFAICFEHSFPAGDYFIFITLNVSATPLESIYLDSHLSYGYIEGEEGDGGGGAEPDEDDWL